MQSPFVSVIVVNYNGGEFLPACLDSVARQTYPRHRFETIVVDNGSTDGSADAARRSHPWARSLRLGGNRGFAGGNNAGIAVARGRWLALLNCDAVAEPNWLAEAVNAGENGPGVVGVACRIVFRDDPWMFNSTGLELYHDGRAGDRDAGINTAFERRSGEVFGGCGAAVLLRKDAVDRVGRFDERLFLYSEDLDLAWRMRRAGGRFVYAPRARVRHVGSGTVGLASAFQTRFVDRNRTLVNVRHAPLWLAVLNGLGQFARTGRSAFRWITGRTTTAHVRASVRGLGEMLAMLPGFALDRFASGGADRLFRRWSRPVPR